MELPSSFSGSIRFDFFHVDYQGVFPQHQAEQKCCEPHEQRFKARSRPLSSENAGRAVPVPPPAAHPCQVVRLRRIVAEQSSKRHYTKPGTFFGAIIARKGSGFLFCVIFLRVATTEWDKQNNSRQNHSNQRLILKFHMSSAGGRTRTLSPERDFKSLVSASLRQSRFSFVVSFDFSLRERFFLRERGGFALF